MKMEHDIKAAAAGVVREVTMGVGDIVREGYPLMYIEEADEQDDGSALVDEEVPPDLIRPDLQLVNERHEIGWDENRPADVARRRRFDQRTARENIFDLCDEGTFVEYGPLVVARQRRRQTEEWLREHSAGDGMVCGVGTVNGALFDDVRSRAILLAYDYTVFAGTQGGANHYKQDRMFKLAKRFRMPLVLYSEGGGGRPGDTDGPGGVGMDTPTFTEFAQLSGLVPLVGINSGRCFAGHTSRGRVCR
jgi:acetyl-CoA carboxylase carboxyltransferase component